MSPEYRERVRHLFTLFEYSQDIMRSMHETKAWVGIEWQRGQAVYTMMFAHQAVGSAMALLPGTHIRSDFEHPVQHILLPLARLVWESLYTTVYLLEPVSPEIRSLQKAVWEYAAEKGRLSVLEDARADHPLVSEVKPVADKLWAKVEQHSLYKTIPSSHRRLISMGRESRILPVKKIRGLIDADDGYLDATYNHMSKYAHQSAYAAQQFDALGQDPSYIPKAISVTLLNFLYPFSLVIKCITRELELTMPVDVWGITSYYANLLSKMGSGGYEG